MSAIFQYGGYTITEIGNRMVQVIAEPVVDTHFDVGPLPHFHGFVNYINENMGEVYLPQKIAKSFGKFVVIEPLPDFKPKFAAAVIPSEDWLAEHGLALNFETYEEIPFDNNREKEAVMLRKLPEINLRRLNFRDYFG